MTEAQKSQCHQIIHSAAAASATVGAGMAQVPVADNLILVPIQITMVVALGRVFDQHITESISIGIIMGTAATYFGRATSQILVFWLPGFGNAINASTAASLTEVIGWGIVDRFDLTSNSGD